MIFEVDKINIKKKTIFILGIFLIALILRLIVSSNLDVRSDEAVYGIRGINFLSTERLSMMEQSVTYYYVQAIIYELFGVSVLTTRFLNIFFGAFATILIFLIGTEFFSRNKAYLASFLFAISGYSILRNVEMDMMAIFFMLFSLYFYIKALKYDPKNYIYAAFFLGLGIMTKSFAMLLFPIYFIYYFLYHRKIKINKKIILMIIYSAITFILLVTPVLSYNYFLYKDKGQVDIIFSQYLGLHQEQYQGLGAEKSWEFTRFLSIGQGVFNRFLKEDFLILTLGIIGIFLSYYQKRKMTTLFLLSALVPAAFFPGITSSGNHYITIIPFLCLFASISITSLVNIIKKKVKFKHILTLILILFLIVNVVQINNSDKKGFAESSMVELRESAKTIPDNAFVVADSRIYRGNIAYAFHDKHYIESSYFSQVVNQANQFPSQNQPIETYYIECVTDDCGWGASKISPQLQNSSESITSFFSGQSTKIKTINDGYSDYAIYKTTLNLKPEVLQSADSTHFFFYYPVGWWTTEGVFDIYEVKGVLDSIINLIAYILLWIGIISALLSPLYLIYLFRKETA